MIPDNERSCTDIICTILMALSIAAFVGLLVYGIVSGNFFAVVAMHNTDGFRCNTDPDFKCKTAPIHRWLSSCLRSTQERGMCEGVPLGSGRNGFM